MSDIVYLFGNGLSMGVSPAFGTGTLTARLRGRLSAQERSALSDIRQFGRPDSLGEARHAGFEDYAGPIDRVSAAVRALAPLADPGGPSRALIDAYAYLRRRYIQLVGIVLEEIESAASLGSSEQWGRLNNFTEALLNLHAERPSSLFTLSYDTLLESSLLNAGSSRFYDGFAGMELNQPLNCYPSKLRSYHLHGSVLWYAQPDGVIRKERSGTDAHHRRIQGWASGSVTDTLPVVLLTDLKTEAASQFPFDVFYAELWNELTDARLLVVGGYGFRDAPVNGVIRAWLMNSEAQPSRRLEVWGPALSVLGVVNRMGLRAELAARISCKTVSLPDSAAVDALRRRPGIG